MFIYLFSTFKTLLKKCQYKYNKLGISKKSIDSYPSTRPTLKSSGRNNLIGGSLKGIS